MPFSLRVMAALSCLWVATAACADDLPADASAATRAVLSSIRQSQELHRRACFLRSPDRRRQPRSCREDRSWVQLSLYLDTTDPAPGGTEIGAVFEGVGVNLTGVTDGTRIVVVDPALEYEGRAVSGEGLAVSRLIEQKPSGSWPPSSEFVFDFAARPVCEFQFVRPELIVGPNGVSHAAWSAQALDSAGAVVGAASEELLRCFGEPGCHDALGVALLADDGRPIRSVRVQSNGNLNGRPFAGFPGVLMGNVVVNYCSSPASWTDAQ